MKSCKIQKKAVSVLLACVFTLVCAITVFNMGTVTGAAEAVYYSDTDYTGGTMQEASEYVYRDSYTVDTSYRTYQAPSYGNSDASIKNFCAVTAGTNIAVFYDKTYTNLVPNFEPGMLINGIFTYYPDLGWPQTEQLFYTLYDDMKTNQSGIGTSGSNFKSGLQAYAARQGYNISFSSMYSSSTNVNLTTFGNAVMADKVGVLLLSKYNYIYAITHNDERTFISKATSNGAHIMMVYGYIKINFYNDGELFRTDTFLQASSGFSSGDQGYIKVDDYLTIEEALIVNIS